MEQIGSAFGLEGLNLPLLAVGLLMVGLGALVPGTQPKAVTALIVTGSSLTALGVLAPIYREFEISLTKFRVARGDEELPAPWMVAEAETLSSIARLVLGEPELARNTVEDALSKVRRVSRQIPRDDREVMKLKTLVALLDRAEQKRTLAGGHKAGNAAPTSVIEALQELDFSDRVAFALRSEFPLKEVAAILECPEEDIAVRAERARSRIGSGVAGGAFDE